MVLLPITDDLINTDDELIKVKIAQKRENKQSLSS